MVRRWFFLVVLVIAGGMFTLSCTSGSSATPEKAARSFVEAFARGDANSMLDSMCTGETSGVVVAVDVDWRHGIYQVVSKSTSQAQVRVKGEMFLTVEDIQQIASQIGADLPKISGGTKVGVDFDKFYVVYDADYDEWCVPRDTKNAFFDYLWDQILSALTL